MRMLHATPTRNLRRILCNGLKASRSKGAVDTVWLVAPGMTGAAITHAAKRHRVHATQVSVIEVDVPRAWLRKGKRKGLWHTGGRNVPRERIKFVSGFIRIEAGNHATA